MNKVANGGRAVKPSTSYFIKAILLIILVLDIGAASFHGIDVFETMLLTFYGILLISVDNPWVEWTITKEDIKDV